MRASRTIMVALGMLSMLPLSGSAAGMAGTVWDASGAAHPVSNFTTQTSLPLQGADCSYSITLRFYIATPQVGYSSDTSCTPPMTSQEITLSVWTDRFQPGVVAPLNMYQLVAQAAAPVSATCSACRTDSASGILGVTRGTQYALLVALDISAPDGYYWTAAPVMTNLTSCWSDTYEAQPQRLECALREYFSYN